VGNRGCLYRHRHIGGHLKDGLPGLKMRTMDETPSCLFNTDDGCRIYENRPTACRYYPVALLSMRKQDEYTDSHSFAVVKEDHCQGTQCTA